MAKKTLRRYQKNNSFINKKLKRINNKLNLLEEE